MKLNKLALYILTSLLLGACQSNKNNYPSSMGNLEIEINESIPGSVGSMKINDPVNNGYILAEDNKDDGIINFSSWTINGISPALAPYIMPDSLDEIYHHVKNEN